MNQLNEPLTDPKNERFIMKPIDPQYEFLWSMYKRQQEVYWTAEEIDFSNDYDDFKTLTPDEQQFIKMVLAFFSASDMIVNFNINERFSKEIKIREALAAYDFQTTMENIHSEVYSDMLINIIKDRDEQDKLTNAFKEIGSIKKMSDWAFKWIESDKSLAHRIVAFAIIEGVFFSGAFACIYWLKKHRCNGKAFMNGLISSNEFIARDEGLHVNFACALYSYIVNRVSFDEIKQIFNEAIDISKEFTEDAIQCRLIGMNVELMHQYIKYVSDRLLVMLGYEKIYHVSNPFDFMETIGLLSKDNFFEKRPTAYQKSHNEETVQMKNDWIDLDDNF